MSGVPILTPPGGDLIRHHPEVMREEQAKAQAIIEVAAKLKDWKLLEQAIDAKIGQQIEFCQWWLESVRERGRPEKDFRAEIFSLDEAQQRTGVTAVQVSRWRQRTGTSGSSPSGIPELVERYAEHIRVAAYRKAGLQSADNFRAEGTGVDEWFTPAEYVESVRAVLGDIDLDPATHPLAQEYIKATRSYTKADDALSREWYGRVWLNPPYSRELIGAFVTKLVAEIDAERVEAAIILTHNYTDTDWFHRIAAIAQAICFTRGRIRFVDNFGDRCAPTQGQAFFYHGLDVGGFADVFGAYGLILYP